MNAYLLYLLYVGAVVLFSILMLRRESARPNRTEVPKVLEVALLRGGLGAVVETVIFDLQLRNLIETKVDRSSKRVVATISNENLLELSKLEADALEAFEAVQGQSRSLKKARRQIGISVKELEHPVQAAGWWKRPTRWKWGLTILSPGLIVFGSLRFIDSYEGGLQVALALTVPVFAVLMRRVILHEMTGPTARGRKTLQWLREEKQAETNPLWQVALHGTQQLKEMPEYRLFVFMTKGIPYRSI